MTRAAASSMASGSPSRRRQISATASALSGVSANSGWTNRQRSTKRTTAGFCRSRVISPTERSGTWSGESGNSRSHRRRNRSRLVAMILRSGHAPRSRSTYVAASITCSKLSRISRVCRFLRYSSRLARRGRPGVSPTPRTWAMEGRTDSGLLMWASVTKNAPS